MIPQHINLTNNSVTSHEVDLIDLSLFVIKFKSKNLTKKEQKILQDQVISVKQEIWGGNFSVEVQFNQNVIEQRMQPLSILTKLELSEIQDLKIKVQMFDRNGVIFRESRYKRCNFHGSERAANVFNLTYEFLPDNIAKPFTIRFNSNKRNNLLNGTLRFK